MTALITGASSGIGRDIARVLSKRGFDLILVARRTDRLKQLQQELSTDVRIISLDLSLEQSCFELYELVSEDSIDILINNAGFGIFGTFNEIDLQRELQMIDVNIRAVNILTKLFLRDFIERDSGLILNVSSSSAFLPGPLLSSYYASKAYILRLSQAIYEELRRAKSNVHISVLCPGPVKTEFDEKADVKFSIRGLTSEYVANYAVRKTFEHKLVIIPGIKMKLVRFFSHLLPDKLLMRAAWHIQKRKQQR